MFSVIFPGQGSQTVGMAKNIYEKFSFVKELFHKADDVLGVPISKIILNGPKEELDLTENTQPAIFIVSYSILQLIKKETNIDINKAKFFAGHSLGEYSALAASESINFEQTLKLLKVRGRSMQSAVPKGEGGRSHPPGVSDNIAAGLVYLTVPNGDSLLSRYSILF